MSKHLPYRRGVGIILFNADGLVWVGRRLDQPGDCWQMPQGGIDDDESPSAAALRELAEETGTSQAEILAESRQWFTYDLPPDLLGVAWQGRYRGQRQKWFALRFLGRDADINIAMPEPEFAEWRWVAFDRLVEMIVPFKRALYREITAEFKGLAKSLGTVVMGSFAVAGSGFSLGLSLILPIGAQNSFVLRQGLRREHVFFVCLVCALSDAVLMLAGISGLSVVIKGMPWLAQGFGLFGVVFLLAYGGRSFWRAWAKADQLVPGQSETRPLLATLLTCLALTWLNPHVYLDTVLLISSIAQQYPGAQYSFAAGAMLASCLFFYSLGYGAALLRPILAKPLAWRILEVLIGLCMWAIAGSLLREIIA